MADRVDVVVVGAGPAGCAAAIAATRAGVSVAVVEARAGTRPSIGESLPPESGLLLRRLGVWERFEASAPEPCVGSTSSWGSSVLGFNDALFSPHGPGWHIDRRVFDAMLAAAVEEAGVRVHRPALVEHLDVSSTGVTLHLSCGAARSQLQAAVVVDATGMRARVAGAIGVRRHVHDRLVCVAATLPLEDGAEFSQQTVLEAVEHGWWYAARLGRKDVIAVVASDSDVVRRLDLTSAAGWRSALRQTHHIAYALGAARFNGLNLVTMGAMSTRLARTSGSRWMAIGDAAGTFDPLLSQGVHKALAEGLLAVRGIERRLGGAQAPFAEFDASVAQRFESYQRARHHFYASERRWQHAPFWRRRQVHHLLPQASTFSLEEAYR